MIINKFSQNSKAIILGTALWGWGVNKHEAFELLDEYIDRGGIFVDTATNYPINKQVQDNGLVLKWLQEWCVQNPSVHLYIIVKIGSIRNDGGSDLNLTRTTILNLSEKLLNEFGNRLGCISVHWDNRGKSNIKDIAESVEALTQVQSQGLSVGLSGIDHPELYLHVNQELARDWLIQCKENILSRSSLKKYKKVFPHATYLAYGINMGGIKFTDPVPVSSVHMRRINIDKNIKDALGRIVLENTLLSEMKTMNHLALIVCCRNSGIHGVILGPRNKTQLIDSLKFWDVLASTSSCCLDKIIAKINAATVRLTM